MTDDELAAIRAAVAEALDDALDDPDGPLRTRLRRLGTLAVIGFVVLALGTAFAVWSADQASKDRREDAAEAVERDRQIARTAFITTCERQNDNRTALRGTIEGFASLVGGFIVASVEDPNEVPRAQQFSDRLDDLAAQAAQTAAPPVDCTFPPPNPETTAPTTTGAP